MPEFSRKRTAGQWWSINALLGPDELFQALSQFPSLAIFITNRRVPASESGSIPLQDYLANYARYVDSLSGGQSLDHSVTSLLYASLTLDSTIFNSRACPDPNYKVLECSKPVVGVSPLDIAYLAQRNMVRVNCMGRERIHFGLSFSHHNVWNVYQAAPANPYDPTRFPNIELIEKLTEWIKKHSKPCKIRVKDKEQTLGVRLGKQVVCWINEHTGLARQSISVKTSSPMTADPTWRSPAVVQLAQSISNERAYDRLPILADALEESGCTDPNVLHHCRQKRDHVRDCWVVNMILGSK
jgi:hypothetical protein